MARIQGLILSTLFLGLGGAGAACGSNDSSRAASSGQGSEGHDCFPNTTCNAGLTCLSNLCVRLQEAGAGGGATGSGGSSHGGEGAAGSGGSVGGNGAGGSLPGPDASAGSGGMGTGTGGAGTATDGSVATDAGADGAIDASPTWTPADLITGQLFGWFNDSAGSIVTSVDGDGKKRVSLWSDLSPKKNDLSQNRSADGVGVDSQPFLVEGIVNGHAVVHFDGLTTWMGDGAAILPNITDGNDSLLVEIVARQQASGPRSGDPGFLLWSMGRPDYDRPGYVLYVNKGAGDSPVGVLDLVEEVGPDDVVFGTKVFSNAKFHSLGFRYDPNGWPGTGGPLAETRVDGKGTLTQADQLGPSSPLLMLIGGNYGRSLWTGDVAEIVIVRNPTDGDVANIDAYLKRKFLL